MLRTLATGLLTLLIGALLGASLAWGWHSHLQQKAQAASQSRYAKDVNDGARSVAAVQAADGAIADNQTQLNEEINRASTALVSCRPAAVALGRNAGGPGHDRARAADAAGLPTAELQQPGATAQAPLTPAEGLVEVAAEPQLSWAAVRLWNSALAARPVAAGACSPDEPASIACSLDAGIRFDQLWLNHTTNASSCAQDRSQLTELIQLLHQRQTATENHP